MVEKKERIISKLPGSKQARVEAGVSLAYAMKFRREGKIDILGVNFYEPDGEDEGLGVIYRYNEEDHRNLSLFSQLTHAVSYHMEQHGVPLKNQINLEMGAHSDAVFNEDPDFYLGKKVGEWRP